MDQKEFARMGGKAVFKKRGKDWMKEISKRGVEARKEKDRIKDLLKPEDVQDL